MNVSKWISVFKNTSYGVQRTYSVSLRRVFAGLFRGAAILGFVVGLGHVIAGTTVIEYDPLSRIIGTTDGLQSVGTYGYDSTGNITNVRATSSSPMSIVGFYPSSGVAGASVVIQGNGFAASPTANTVQFNGATATVVSATENKLTAVVPVGATSGLISVKQGSTTVNSATAFTVNPSLGAPTITGVSPLRGSPGTSVTIVGTGFDTTAANDYVTFGDSQAQVLSASKGQLVVAVPPSAGSGKITVQTRYGQVTSTQDFFVIPATMSASSVAEQYRITVGASSIGLTKTGPGQNALLLFDGQQGQRIVIATSNSSYTQPLSGTVFSPSGAVVQTLSVPNNSSVVLDKKLQSTGTYTLVLNASTAGISQISLNAKITASNVVLTRTVPLPSPNYNIILKAQVSGDGPQGSILIKNGTQVLATMLLDGNGTASLPISTLPAGLNSLTATYAGDLANGSSSANINITVPTTVSIVDNQDATTDYHVKYAWTSTTQRAGYYGTDYQVATFNPATSTMDSNNSRFSTVGNWSRVVVPNSFGTNVVVSQPAVSPERHYPPVIIDNLRDGYVSYGNYVTTLSGYYGNDYLVLSANTKWKNLYQITLEGNTGLSGTFPCKLYAWWPASANNASNVVYRIKDDSGSVLATFSGVNQRVNGSQWVYIGSYSAAPHAAIEVDSTGANGDVIVDALKVEWQDPNPNYAQWQIPTNLSGTYDFFERTPNASLGNIEGLQFWTIGGSIGTSGNGTSGVDTYQGSTSWVLNSNPPAQSNGGIYAGSNSSSLWMHIGVADLSGKQPNFVRIDQVNYSQWAKVGADAIAYFRRGYVPIARWARPRNNTCSLIGGFPVCYDHSTTVNVWAYWPPSADLVKDARYIIRSNNDTGQCVSTVVTVDQTKSGMAELGTFKIGEACYYSSVIVNLQPNVKAGNLAADAIVFYAN